MLIIDVPIGEEKFDDEAQAFVRESFRLQMEHSLLSLSKWEAEFEKPFLSDTPKTSEELLWYVKAMTLTPGVPDEIFYRLSEENVKSINDYINANMTATTFRTNPNQKRNREIITAEVIYYWMFSAGIPLDFENRHLAHLLTLIKVFSAKNQPPQKMSKAEIMRQQRDLNAQRRAAMGSSG